MAKKKEVRKPVKKSVAFDEIQINLRDVLKLLEMDRVTVGGKKLVLADGDEDLYSWERIAEVAEAIADEFEEDDDDDDDDDYEDEDEDEETEEEDED